MSIHDIAPVINLPNRQLTLTATINVCVEQAELIDGREKNRPFRRRLSHKVAGSEEQRCIEH